MNTEKHSTQVTPEPLPTYQTPPVNEVVCGVYFKPLNRLLIPHFGLLWELFRADYPRCDEAPPLAPTIENLSGPPDGKPLLLEYPPLPRTWFISQAGNAVIQVQRDRFHHNWRKRADTDEYPRYDSVFTSFSEQLRNFREFVESQNIGVIEPLQYEMSYVNHISGRDGWLTTCDTGNVFPDFAWAQKQRFLPCPEGIQWRTSFVAPDLPGRLHVVISNGRNLDDGKSICVMDLTVRGISEEKSINGMKPWFDKAREWIVRGFTDLTAAETQDKAWRRKR